MKTRLFYFVLILVAVNFFSTNVFSQTKRAMFLHGYSSNPSTAWINVPRLDPNVTNVPQTWINEGIIDDYTVPDFGTVVNKDAYGQIVLDAMATHDPQNDSRWVMVGHSLGGLGARGVEPYVKNGVSILGVNYPPRNLKGIITLGTPHQGAPAAASISNNEANVLSIASGIRDDINAGPEWQSSWGWAGVFIPLNFGFAEDLIYSTVSVYYYKDFSGALNNAYNTTKKYITDAAANNASMLAPNSSFINELNSPLLTPSVVPHISISGGETAPTFIRFISTLDDLGAKFSNEVDAVNTLNQMINTYASIENFHYSYTDDWYDYLDYPTWLFHHEGWVHWTRGRSSLQNLDVTWAEMHNEVLSVTNTYYSRYWVNCGGGGYSVQDLEKLFFEFIPCRDEPGVAADGGYWATTPYTYTTYYSDITDGFIPKQRTKWKWDDSFVAQGTAPSDVRQGNISFDGTGEADGGYNHGELRFPKRNYGAKDYTQPFLFSKDWANYWIIQP